MFRLKRPIPYFPKALSYYGSPIVAPETVSEDGKMSGLIGTGPFRLGAVKPADSLEVLAFDDYRGGRPEFDRVVFRTIPDADSRLMALTAGQIDAIVDFGGIFPHQLPELLRTPGLESDPHHRRNLYRRLCELMNQHLPMLPLYHDVAVYAYRDRKEIARKIQIVWQDPVIYLNPYLTALNFLTEALAVLGVARRLRTERAAELFAMVHLAPSLMRRKPHELSGGQAQRLAIARAMAMEPEILICDEATWTCRHEHSWSPFSPN